MSNTIGSALGGITVAARRSAQSPTAPSGKVVNLRGGAVDTTGFRPLDLKPVSPPETNFGPTTMEAASTALQANAQLTRDSGDLIAARRAFEANVAAVSTADKMIGSLFDEEV
ncbi:MAG: flagellar basal body rod C-terminal domain-containing protein [Alphaproteobacteria bacterium]